MKLSKPLIITLVSVLTVLAVIVSVPSILNSGSEYKELLTEARRYNENNLCQKAMLVYDQALAEQDSLELRLEMAKNYKQGMENGEFDSYYKYSNFLFELLEKYRKEPKAYDIVVQYFYDFNKIEDCVLAIYQAEEFNIKTETVNKIRDEVRYLCATNFSTFENVSFTPEDSYLIKNEKYSMHNANMGSINGRKFDYATPMLNGYALVKDGEYTYLISEDSMREAYFPNEITESTGVGNALVACKIGDAYSYYDLTGKKVFGDYQFAGRFANGVAPVKTDKGWFLINTDGKQIGSTVFEDIKLSQANDCSQSGVIVAKANGKYSLYDCGLKKISDYTFDDADVLINEDSLLAIEKEGKWGFIDASGKVVIEPKYEAARSFSNGLAGVKDGEFWSFINEKNEKVITGEFNDVNYFNSKGNCFVKDDNYWFYLSRYYNR